MHELMADAMALQPFLLWLLACFTFVVKVALAILGVLFQVAFGLIVWGVLILGPSVIFLLIITWLTTLLSGNEGNERSGLIRKTLYRGSTTISLLAISQCALIIGGLGNYTWHLVDQAWLVSESPWVSWLKYGTGFISAIFTITFLCSHELAGNMLSSMNNHLAESWKKPFVGLLGICLVLGFVWPIAFNSFRSEYAGFANRIVAKANGAEIPDVLRGSVFRGRLVGSTYQSRMAGLTFQEEIVISFGNQISLISINGSPLPCRVQENSIHVPTYQKNNLWLDLSFDKSGTMLFYRMRNVIDDDVIVTEGVLERLTQSVTDQELSNEFLNGVLRAHGVQY